MHLVIVVLVAVLLAALAYHVCLWLRLPQIVAVIAALLSALAVLGGYGPS